MLNSRRIDDKYLRSYAKEVEEKYLKLLLAQKISCIKKAYILSA